MHCMNNTVDVDHDELFGIVETKCVRLYQDNNEGHYMDEWNGNGTLPLCDDEGTLIARAGSQQDNCG